MLHEDRQSVEAATPGALAEQYRAALADVVDAHGGPAAVAAETGVDEDAVASLVAGDADAIEFADAAALQALASDLDAETIEAEACDNLLLGMSMAVLDVEAIAAEYEGEGSAKAIQQRLERRAPMTLAEFARIEHFVASRR